ncbi:MAG: 1-acyl-sn-glycerol-3-phosphate acyltransferase [Ruminococcaceae bacterium]|nr:1-acyl-sn-glycerol-3-phosphate acyltransferase [Oscillospiraceae bacterium]
MNKFYTNIKRFFGGLFKRLYRVRIVNPEKEPLGLPYLVCCNHTALMDVTVISLAMKSQVHYMAKKEVFKVPILRSFAKAMGAFPVDRKHGDVGAVKKTIELLKSGECVGVFPQGTRKPYVHPRDTEIKNGIGMFADRAGVGILPVCIRTKKHKLKLFRKTEFVIGEYIPPEDIKFEEYTGKEKYQKISDYAFSKICELYDEVAEQ